MDRLTRFGLSRSFALYYGRGREDELGEFDIAVVEPLGQNLTSIQKLKEKGTLVIAYLSILEVMDFKPEARFLKDNDYLTVNGKRICSEKYGNCWADLRSPLWNNILFHQASLLLEYHSYDGLFLDTLGYLDDGWIPFQLRGELLAAACRILERIRLVFPNHIIIQNCGLERVIDRTFPYLNGVCWENPPLGHSQWTDEIVSKLTRLKEEHSWQIFILAEDDREKNSINYVRSMAAERGFLFYKAPQGYTSGVIRKM